MSGPHIWILTYAVHVPVNTSRGGPRAALQGGLLIPKNASRNEQLQKQGGTADLCNLFDAMDTQLPTTTNGKTSSGSKIVASLDKPGMFSVLSSLVLFVVPSTSSSFMSRLQIWTSSQESCV
jgi:ABC-type Na+ efflux pump permease subunit